MDAANARPRDSVLTLHAPTLAAMLTVVTFTTGLLLMLSWLQNRSVSSLLWWATANLVAGVSSSLFTLRGLAPDMLTVDVANATMFLAFALMWVGVRRFCGKRGDVIVALAPAIAVLLLHRWPAFAQSSEWRMAVSSLGPASYAVAMAWELAQLKNERLVSRWPAIGWLLIHAAFFGVRAPLAFVITPPPVHAMTTTPWFSVVAFEALLNVIAMAFLQIAMIRERAENQQRQAAHTDALTGAPNRRALLSEAERVVRQGEAAGHPVCALLIDIDHFKSINDSFGHDGGDAVLIGVADTMRAHLRAGDVFGRLGGEEFVCLLPNTSTAAAMTVAEGLRARVAGLRMMSGQRQMRVSVSIGVASSEDGRRDATALLREADRRLYEAKAQGRNRVAADGAPAQRAQLRLA
jgi:diguanylate cyclase (GGDEF)-like protein